MLTTADELTTTIPLVTDRMLLELANGITVARDLSTRRAGFFSRLAGRSGTDLAVAGLARGEHTLMTWLTEVSARAAVSDLALARTTAHVEQTRRQVRHLVAETGRIDARLRHLATVVASAIEHFDERIADLERRQHLVELRVAAAEAFDVAVDAWAAGRTYAGLPWSLRIALLGRAVASGPCGRFEHLMHSVTYRTRLVDRILHHPSTRSALSGPRALVGLLDHDVRALAGTDRAQMVAELLDSGLSPTLALPARPLTATMTAALELGALPEPARPGRPAAAAFELVRRRIGPLDETTDPRSFVRDLVFEPAEAADEVRVSHDG